MNINKRPKEYIENFDPSSVSPLDPFKAVRNYQGGPPQNPNADPYFGYEAVDIRRAGGTISAGDEGVIFSVGPVPGHSMIIDGYAFTAVDQNGDPTNPGDQIFDLVMGPIELSGQKPGNASVSQTAKRMMKWQGRSEMGPSNNLIDFPLGNSLNNENLFRARIIVPFHYILRAVIRNTTQNNIVVGARMVGWMRRDKKGLQPGDNSLG